jgi:CubicO group peptidase (beta-lactamase class C family)
MWEVGMRGESVVNTIPGSGVAGLAAVAGIWLLALATPAGVIAQEAESPAPGCVAAGRPLIDAVRAVHTRQRNVGYQLAVYHHGALVVRDIRGFADLEHRIPVNDETEFGIASITKAFTGAAVLKLVDAGQIDLDAPIRDYVPEYPEKPEGPVTVRQLLTHTSGIPHPDSELRRETVYRTHYDDVLAALEPVKDEPLEFAPGTDVQYSSTNYNLLAAAIEKVTGTPFPDYVRETILEPLHLAHTVFDDVRRVIPHRARQYVYLDPWDYTPHDDWAERVPPWDFSFNMGGGNLLSTAEDLVRYGAAFLDGSSFFTAEELDRIYTPQADGPAESPWSFGWVVGDGGVEGPRLLMTGGNPGRQAALVVFRKHELVVAIVANSWGVGAGDLEMINVRRFARLCMGWPEPEED